MHKALFLDQLFQVTMMTVEEKPDVTYADIGKCSYYFVFGLDILFRTIIFVRWLPRANRKNSRSCGDAAVACTKFSCWSIE
jgi:hypothetical protein